MQRFGDFSVYYTYVLIGITRTSFRLHGFFISVAVARYNFLAVFVFYRRRDCYIYAVCFRCSCVYVCDVGYVVRNAVISYFSLSPYNFPFSFSQTPSDLCLKQGVFVVVPCILSSKRRCTSFQHCCACLYILQVRALGID